MTATENDLKMCHNFKCKPEIVIFNIFSIIDFGSENLLRTKLNNF